MINTDLYFKVSPELRLGYIDETDLGEEQKKLRDSNPEMFQREMDRVAVSLLMAKQSGVSLAVAQHPENTARINKSLQTDDPIQQYNILHDDYVNNKIQTLVEPTETSVLRKIAGGGIAVGLQVGSSIFVGTEKAVATLPYEYMYGTHKQNVLGAINRNSLYVDEGLSLTQQELDDLKGIQLEHEVARNNVLNYDPVFLRYGYESIRRSYFDITSKLSEVTGVEADIFPTANEEAIKKRETAYRNMEILNNIENKRDAYIAGMLDRRQSKSLNLYRELAKTVAFVTDKQNEVAEWVAKDVGGLTDKDINSIEYQLLNAASQVGATLTAGTVGKSLSVLSTKKSLGSVAGKTSFMEEFKNILSSPEKSFGEVFGNLKDISSRRAAGKKFLQDNFSDVKLSDFDDYDYFFNNVITEEMIAKYPQKYANYIKIKNKFESLEDLAKKDAGYIPLRDKFKDISELSFDQKLVFAQISKKYSETSPIVSQLINEGMNGYARENGIDMENMTDEQIHKMMTAATFYSTAAYILEKTSFDAILGKARLPIKAPKPDMNKIKAFGIRAARFSTELAKAGITEGTTEAIQSLQQAFINDIVNNENIQLNEEDVQEAYLSFVIGALTGGVTTGIAKGVMYSSGVNNDGGDLARGATSTFSTDNFNNLKTPESKKAYADAVGLSQEQREAFGKMAESVPLTPEESILASEAVTIITGREVGLDPAGGNVTVKGVDFAYNPTNQGTYNISADGVPVATGIQYENLNNIIPTLSNIGLEQPIMYSDSGMPVSEITKGNIPTRITFASIGDTSLGNGVASSTTTVDSSGALLRKILFNLNKAKPIDLISDKKILSELLKQKGTPAVTDISTKIRDRIKLNDTELETAVKETNDILTANNQKPIDIDKLKDTISNLHRLNSVSENVNIANNSLSYTESDIAIVEAVYLLDPTLIDNINGNDIKKSIMKKLGADIFDVAANSPDVYGLVSSRMNIEIKPEDVKIDVERTSDFTTEEKSAEELESEAKINITLDNLYKPFRDKIIKSDRLKKIDAERTEEINLGGLLAVERANIKAAEQLQDNPTTEEKQYLSFIFGKHSNIIRLLNNKKTLDDVTDGKADEVYNIFNTDEKNFVRDAIKLLSKLIPKFLKFKKAVDLSKSFLSSRGLLTRAINYTMGENIGAKAIRFAIWTDIPGVSTLLKKHGGTNNIFLARTISYVISKMLVSMIGPWFNEALKEMGLYDEMKMVRKYIRYLDPVDLIQDMVRDTSKDVAQQTFGTYKERRSKGGDLSFVIPNTNHYDMFSPEILARISQLNFVPVIPTEQIYTY